MKKLLKTLALVAVFGVIIYATGALAGEGGLDSVTKKLADTFKDVKGVFFVLAAFGLIGLAAAALLGKVQWKWLFALVFGVAIVAAAGYIVQYAAGEGADIEELGDTAIESQ